MRRSKGSNPYNGKVAATGGLATNLPRWPDLIANRPLHNPQVAPCTPSLSVTGELWRDVENSASTAIPGVRER